MTEDGMTSIWTAPNGMVHDKRTGNLVKISENIKFLFVEIDYELLDEDEQEFYSSLLQYFHRHGTLTDKQFSCLENMWAMADYWELMPEPRKW